ncbi:MAG: DUF1127 domain-containing protein [Alphaproteobacteria bacterium]|nr:MAG: DUF1127 domain-containing protein [Alphaproteobacteria bacterium]
MTAIDTAVRATGFAFAPRLTRFIETLVGRVAEAQARRATRRALEKLTARELDDIGLTRADIYRRF